MEMVTNNYLLVKMVKQKTKTSGGLELADQSLGEPQWGWVLDVGEGLCDMNGVTYKPDFEIGDLVYFEKHAPRKVDYTPEGLQVLHIISEGDVRIKLRLAADGSAQVIPMGNYVHVEPLEDSVQKVTPGGIVLPDQIVERPTKGRVMAVGRGQRTASGFHSPKVKPGDIVRYLDHAALEVRFRDINADIDTKYLVSYGDIVLIETENYKEELQKRLDSILEK